MIQESTIFLKKEDYEKLLKRIEQMEKENLKLREENAELRRRLGMDSTNSSRPPSSDPPSVKRPSKVPTGRKPGKQKGSKGYRRQRLQPTQIIEHRPEVCSHCGGNIPADTSTTGSYQYRQQVEIPPIEPIVTEHHYHAVRCPNCGKTTRAEVGEGEKPCCGPRLTALIAILTTVYNLSRRHVEGLLETVLGVDLILGSVDNRVPSGCHEVGDALESPVSQLKEQLPQEAKLHIDETGWKKAGERRRLWVFVAPTFTFFHIAGTRGKKVLREILGENFLGFIISDCYSSYRSYHDLSRWHICLAHLIRKAKGLSLCEDPEASRFGHWVRRELKLMISLWKKKLSWLLAYKKEDPTKIFSMMEEQLQKEGEELDQYLQFILETNRPSVVEVGGFEKLYEIADRTYLDITNEERNYITPTELVNLSVGKGSLNKEERREIESHVIHTYQFLTQIPWTKELRQIPQISSGHHEWLNGEGYPNHLQMDQIPIQAKIMTVCDIFDALTAADRPYKKAVPLNRALDILHGEAGHNHIDQELLKIFIETKVYQLVKNE